MSHILKGAPVAAAVSEELAGRVAELNMLGVEPCLAFLRVGEDESAKAYERSAAKRCAALSIHTVSVTLPESCTQEELTDEIERINADDSIHCCLLFRPLPKHLDELAACELLKPEKDVDCITSTSMNTVLTGRGAGFAPCTAQACLELLSYYGYDVTGKNVAVIGRSLVIGKPVSLMLQNKNATVTMCHTKTVNIEDICRRADILVVSAGHAKMVNEAFVHENQIVVDVGINPLPEGGICGDVDFDKVEPIVSAISPVPGGVGAITTAVLASHVVEAAEKKSQNIIPMLSE